MHRNEELDVFMAELKGLCAQYEALVKQANMLLQVLEAQAQVPSIPMKTKRLN